jgi:hypothetical protein
MGLNFFRLVEKLEFITVSVIEPFSFTTFAKFFRCSVIYIVELKRESGENPEQFPLL